MIYYEEAQSIISILWENTEDYSYIRTFYKDNLSYLGIYSGTPYILSVGITMGVSPGHI